MLQVVSPSLSLISSQPSTSKDAESASNMDVDADLITGARNLSSTLHKLLLWEKKLYNEVKVCQSSVLYRHSPISFPWFYFHFWII